jgi:hypothetical protein
MGDCSAVALEFKTWGCSCGVVEEHEVSAIILGGYVVPVHRCTDELAVPHVAILGSLVGLGFFVCSATFGQLVVLGTAAYADNFCPTGGESGFILVLVAGRWGFYCCRLGSIRCSTVLLFYCL